MAKKNNKLIFILGAVALVLIVAMYFVAQNKPKGIKVSTEAATKRTIKETVSASGKVFPEVEVKISSDVSGEVVELYVEEGDSVKAGQILARIDPDAIESQVERQIASVNNSKAQVANAQANMERNKANIEQAKAQEEQIEAQLVNTREIHRRNIGLFEEGVISQADFEASKANLDGLEANLRSSAAALRSAEANLKASKQTVRASEFTVKSAQATLQEIKTNLNRTTIYAPNDGIVSLLNVEKGERVVGTGMMSGTEMLRIANLNAIEVQVDVSENDILRVEEGDPCEIEVDAYLDKKFTGYVTEIANSASGSETGQVINFVVKIRINPETYKDLIKADARFPFRPGMSASVEITTEIKKDILTVPIQAVTLRSLDEKKKKRKVGNDPEDNDEKEEVVFVPESDTASLALVKTGVQDDTYIEIVKGLSEGDEVISAPYNAISKKLEKGKQLQVVDENKLYDKK